MVRTLSSVPVALRDRIPSAATEAVRASFLRNTRELIELLSAKVLKNRNAVEEYILLGRLFRIQGEPKRALRLHQSLLAKASLERHLETVLHVEIGSDLFDARMGDNGQDHFEKALNLQKQNVAALEGLVRIHEMNEKFDEAVEWIQRLRKLGRPEEKHLAFVYSEIGSRWVVKKEFARARRAVDRALKTHPDSPYALLVLADIFIEAGRYVKAIETLRNYLRRWPTHSFLALRKLEDAHYRMNTFPAYEKTLRDAIRAQPENFYLYHSLGRHLRKKKKREEALEMFRKSIDLNPLYVNAVRDRLELLAEKDNLASLAHEAHTFFSLFKRSRRFICPNCRQRYVPLTWHCENCGTWGVFDIRYELIAP